MSVESASGGPTVTRGRLRTARKAARRGLTLTEEERRLLAEYGEAGGDTR